MKIVNLFIEIELKLKQYMIPFLFLFIVWFSGFMFYVITEPGQDIGALILLSLTVRSPVVASDFSNFYAFSIRITSQRDII